MECPHCGTHIDGEASFCDACGKPLNEAGLVPSASPAEGPGSVSIVREAGRSAAQYAVTDTRPFRRAGYSRKHSSPATALSHWNQMIRGLDLSPMDFYRAVRSSIEYRRVPDVAIALVEISEGGVFSAKREYLRVIRKDHVYDICGAPFGDGFFVSSWLSPRPAGCLTLLLGFPLVGWLYFRFFRPLTYYQVDTASMFLTAVHGAVLDVLDRYMEGRGIRGLSELDRKPIHRDFFGGR